MTDAAAALRSADRAAMPLPLGSRLARRIIASHAGAAMTAVAIVLVDPLGWRVPTDHALGLGVLAVALGVALGARLAWRLLTPIAELARTVEAARGPTARRGAAASDEIRRLSDALRHLSESAASHQDFAADVAHEIRNPLASLRAAAEAMRAAGQAQRETLLDIIEQDVARLDRLVGEVSSASRLDADLVREVAVEFDLTQTVRSLTEHLSRSASAAGIEVMADLPDTPIRLNGLEARLEQVVVNIVENAISLCEEGDAIRVSMRRRDRQALLVVEDTGPGIPAGAAEKIFRRFYSYRPDGGSARNSGLGLAISRQIVEAHGGIIWAENIRPTESDLLSEPLGARFAVVLPL